ncbi:kinase-like domain-containing protein [Aspergillus pseudoustus]|uniref:Kinase-like domain-containing protein n=1 Tax=Aspergillus pseudoustus TaxID=1810923 RepID=A0ABR4J3I3_9EURO
MFLSSQTMSAESGNLVGTICRWDPRTGKTSQSMAIYSRKEIYIGRDPRRCQYAVDDRFVSNKHLWIYTVIFDQDNPGEVAPLVYAQDISMNGTLWNGYRMGNGRSSFLLSDGDILRLSDLVYLKYNSEDYSRAKCFTARQALEMRTFANDYIVTRQKLGSGAYGQVYMAYRRSSGQQFACKIVDLLAVRRKLARAKDMKVLGRPVEQVFSEKVELYLREATILQKLQHPNIIGLERVIRSDSTIYMFQDLVTAGDLFSYIQFKGGKLPDIEAAVIVRQVVVALEFLHDQNIVHRDLKPDNILMTSRADGCRVVLTDFGCATLIDTDSTRMSSMVGTIEFCAPEVAKVGVGHEGGYTKAADLWSLGALTAVLLTGEPPFEDMRWGCITSDEKVTGLMNLNARLERNKVGERAQDFVLRLLEHIAAKRMDVKEALEHPWFTNPSHKDDFEALYKRSTRDWTPRTAKSPRIVPLELYHGPYGSNPQGSDESVEPFVNAEEASQESLELLPLPDHDADDGHSSFFRPASQTLSDPILPPHVAIKNGSSPPNTEYKPQAEISSWHAVTTPPSTDHLRDEEEDEVDGEVYEKVCNPVTEKKQQVTYSARAA